MKFSFASFLLLYLFSILPVESKQKYFGDPGAVYANAKSACILVGDHNSWDRNKAVIVNDENGKPALYLICDRHERCLPLARHCRHDLLSHWEPVSAIDGVYTFKFEFWGSKGWMPVQVAIRFENGYCSHFRVVADAVNEQGWLAAADIPTEIDRPSDEKPLKLPLLLGIAEGPRDMPDCRIGGIPDEYAKALSEGKCPIGMKTVKPAENLIPTDQ